MKRLFSVFCVFLFTLIVLDPCFSVAKANPAYPSQDIYEREATVSSSSLFPVPGGFQAVSVGVYPGGQDVAKYEAQLNVKFDYVLQFQDIMQLNYTEVIQFLDRGYGVILNVEFTDTFANLANVTAGLYDSYLLDLCNSIKKDGRMIWIRTLHEFNGNWYNWGVLYPGNHKEDFIPAWRHVVQFFRDREVPVGFQLDYNNRNGKDDTTPFSVLFPGDAWIDMLVVTNYNRAGTDQWHPPSSWAEFKDSFSSPYTQVSLLTSKPIGVAETSSTTHGGDKPQWIINTLNSIVNDFPRVSQITWFLLNKTVSGVSWDWDLNTVEERDSFSRGMAVTTRGDAVLGDSFDAGFTKWDGKYLTTGEWEGKTTARAHDWNCSAKFTSNGSQGFEYAYCYKKLSNVSWVSARCYVYVLQSGITSNSERMAFMVLRGKSDNIAFVGWRMINGQTKWYLSTRDGNGYRTVYSSQTPSLGKWYGISVEWTMGKSGGAILKVDGIEVCGTASDTTAFGGVLQIRIGLAEIYNCNPSTVYVDCFVQSIHALIFPS